MTTRRIALAVAGAVALVLSSVTLPGCKTTTAPDGSTTSTTFLTEDQISALIDRSFDTVIGLLGTGAKAAGSSTVTLTAEQQNALRKQVVSDVYKAQFKH